MSASYFEMQKWVCGWVNQQIYDKNNSKMLNVEFRCTGIHYTTFLYILKVSSKAREAQSVGWWKDNENKAVLAQRKHSTNVSYL